MSIIRITKLFCYTLRVNDYSLYLLLFHTTHPCFYTSPSSDKITPIKCVQRHKRFRNIIRQSRVAARHNLPKWLFSLSISNPPRIPTTILAIIGAKAHFITSFQRVNWIKIRPSYERKKHPEATLHKRLCEWHTETCHSHTSKRMGEKWWYPFFKYIENVSTTHSSSR